MNGETFNTGKVNISMGCSPVGCSKYVSFTSPEEALITRFLGIGLQLYLPPGIYPIDGTDNAFATYMIGRRGPSGIYVTRYDITEGYIKLVNWDLNNFLMQGSFAYVASVEKLPQLVTGKFELKDNEAPPSA